MSFLFPLLGYFPGVGSVWPPCFTTIRWTFCTPWKTSPTIEVRKLLVSVIYRCTYLCTPLAIFHSSPLKNDWQRKTSRLSFLFFFRPIFRGLSRTSINFWWCLYQQIVNIVFMYSYQWSTWILQDAGRFSPAGSSTSASKTFRYKYIHVYCTSTFQNLTWNIRKKTNNNLTLNQISYVSFNLCLLFI